MQERTDTNISHHTEESWGKLKLGLEMLVKASVHGIEMTGREHLDRLDYQRRIILVPSHIDDLSVPIAALLWMREGRNVAIAHISGQRDPRQDLLTWFGLLVAGSENFLPIDVNKHNGQWKAEPFNPQNFQAMRAAFEERKAIIMAGHSPSDHQLPDRGGIGALYLAHIANAQILPVSIRLDQRVGKAGVLEGIKTVITKPVAYATYGEPITNLQPLEGLDSSQRVTRKHMRQLLEESNQLMRVYAQALPPEQQGKWQDPSYRT